jgi:spoIIIJ-associated protein
MERGYVQTECVKEAASVAEGVDAALEELGVQQDAVEYEVLQEPQHQHQLLGFGSAKPARVRVWIKASYIASLRATEETESTDEPTPIELVINPAEELSDEDLDRVADTAVASLQRILVEFGIDASSIEEYEGDEGEIILDVVGGDLALLIGRHGRTLDSLQALVSAITNRTLGFRYPVVVDVEGYRHRRRQKIEDIARRAADRAARQQGAVRLRPMTAYERRVVHVVLRDDRRVSTCSEGEDPFRVVVVAPR